MENENNVMQEGTVNVAVTEKRCPKCQALILSAEQAFCPECGAPLKKLCSNCKAELQENQTFCSVCGQKADVDVAPPTSSIEQFNQTIVNNGNKSNKKKSTLIIVGIILLVIAVAAYFYVQKTKVEEYKANAKIFCSTTLSAAANLENIGNEIQSEWRDYIYDSWSIYDSVDEAVDGALANKATEVSQARIDKTSIDSLYAKLRKPVNNSAEIEEICDAVKALYGEYEELYEFIINPSGNYNSFKSGFGELDDSTVEAYKELKAICDAL